MLEYGCLIVSICESDEGRFLRVGCLRESPEGLDVYLTDLIVNADVSEPIQKQFFGLFLCFYVLRSLVQREVPQDDAGFAVFNLPLAIRVLEFLALTPYRFQLIFHLRDGRNVGFKGFHPFFQLFFVGDKRRIFVLKIENFLCERDEQLGNFPLIFFILFDLFQQVGNGVLVAHFVIIEGLR